MNPVVQAYLRQQKELGFSTLYAPSLPAEPAEAPKETPEAPAPAVNRKEALARLLRKHGDCTACSLHQTRKKYVFGQGNPEARLMFIGEAPGADEDEQGLAFIGKAGQLLTKMIESGMGIGREEVFIANVLKCRPPGNRDPLPDERERCTPALLEQIRIIRPEFICCLGRISGRFLLKLPDTVSLREMRGRFYDFMGAKVCVTYHPSALLQHAEWKKPAWEDLQFLMKAMGLAIPPRIK